MEMTVEALEQTQWIPVKDKLPEEDGRFLTYIKNPYRQLTYIMVCEYEFKEWDGHTEEDVTRLLSLKQKSCEEREKGECPYYAG